MMMKAILREYFDVFFFAVVALMCFYTLYYAVAKVRDSTPVPPPRVEWIPANPDGTTVNAPR